MSKKPKDFLELKDRLFSRAELLWVSSIAANVFALAVAMLEVVLSGDSKWSVYCGLVALLFPGVAIVLREWAAVPADRASKISHLVLYADSLGLQIPASEQAKVRRWVPARSLADAPYVAPYYSSTLAPGAGRLADNLAESAYFTEHLTEQVVKRVAWFGLVVMGALVAVVYLAANADVNVKLKALPAIARGVAVAIAFLVSGDYAVLLWRFLRLMGSARSAYDAASSLRADSSVRLEDVIPILQEYDSARVQAPPLPRWLHVRHMDELNADYRASHGRG